MQISKFRHDKRKSVCVDFILAQGDRGFCHFERSREKIKKR